MLQRYERCDREREGLSTEMGGGRGEGGVLVIELTKKCLLTEIRAERRTNGSSGGQE
jgi:hypothetical protein